jgi:hypothetical protein
VQRNRICRKGNEDYLQWLQRILWRESKEGDTIVIDDKYKHDYGGTSYKWCAGR